MAYPYQDYQEEAAEDEARRYDATQDELDAREAGRLEGAPVAGEGEEAPATSWLYDLI